ncbi:MAG: hypothetical protein RMK93_00490 [Bacteroidota bacterium]|nr:hypothetical protein [Bacteroidota bacterium]
MLDESDYTALQQLAYSRGLAASTYVRMVIKQQIQEHTAKRQPAE